MSDREKLVELLNDTGEMLAVDEAVATELSGCVSGWIKDKTGFIADYLISNGVTVQKWSGCKYCNGLPMSQMESFTMPNASKKDYDIVTIRYCPMCGRKLPEPPKECE